MILNIDPSFGDLFFGGLSFAEWKFQSFLMILGIFLRIFNKVRERGDRSHKASLSFWVRQDKNWLSVFYSFMLIYILIRFYGEYKQALVEFIPPNFSSSIYLIMIALGFFQHKISDWIRKLTIKKNE
jgi:hypothetical protein